jgi:hypothetical protein
LSSSKLSIKIIPQDVQNGAFHLSLKGLRTTKILKYTSCFVWSDTWSLTLRKEHKLRVFENWVLRRISGPKRKGLTGGWRKLHNEELHNLYS